MYRFKLFQRKPEYTNNELTLVYVSFHNYHNRQSAVDAANREYKVFTQGLHPETYIFIEPV